MNGVAASIKEQLEGIPAISTDYAQVVSGLWGRWFDTQAMRRGVSPESLWNELDIQIDDVDHLADKIGKQIDVPDCLRGQDWLSLATAQEKIHFIQSHYQMNEFTPIIAATGREIYFTSTGDIGTEFDQRGFLSLEPSATKAPIESEAPAKRQQSSSGETIYPVYLAENMNLLPLATLSEAPNFSWGAVSSTALLDLNLDIADAKRLQRIVKAAPSCPDLEDMTRTFERDTSTSHVLESLAKRQGFDGIKYSDGRISVLQPSAIESALLDSRVSNDLAINKDNALYSHPPSYDSILYQYGSTHAEAANTEQLSIAKSLKQAGADPESIRQMTGWHQWIDGRWRFEIDDSRASLKKGAMMLYTPETEMKNKGVKDALKLRRGELPDLKGETPVLSYTGSLSGILDHPTLYEHYPQLRGLFVHADLTSKNVGQGGCYSYGKIPMIQASDCTVEGLQNTIHHEVQHAIQMIECLAYGGSPDEFRAKTPAEAKLYNDLIRDFKLIADYSRSNHCSVPDAAKPLKANLTELGYDRAVACDMTALIENIKELEYHLKTPMERYTLLAGEYEARDVEHRLKLSAEDRIALPPYSHEGTPTEKLKLVLPDADPAAKAVSEAVPKGALLRSPEQDMFRILLSAHQDASTFIHESGHLMLDLLQRYALDPDCPESIKQDYQAICEYLHVMPGNPISVEQHERFADTLVEFFTDEQCTQAVVPGSDTRLSHWLRSVYSDRNVNETDLSPSIKSTLLRMFTGNEQWHDQGVDLDQVALLAGNEQRSAFRYSNAP
ncbi:LPD23 domain-containing protein [Marinobacterium stanieri]|uniref:Large polyvalent protein associated domain-containing protein n=1 Tax=Marinobacterium stanieri TaxID=49186 RepID=A0A1N6XKH7_9GAMM|nr:LPD23 domain-containing protein [Marinobacterium stanieri]SIR02767.1 hypothetical protein SAMN05421647_11473 [Marinobacterium stanieri]